MSASLAELKSAIELFKINSEIELENFKRDFLGKDGEIKKLFEALKSQDAKNALSEKHLKQKVEKEFLDFSVTGLSNGVGSLHPITHVEMKICELLRPFGFKSVLGPEIESEYFCFDALNIPPHHPARDMQDTFYTNGIIDAQILRTHTTSVQARTLKTEKPPIKISTYGRVYRNEKEDASHQAMFHQFELVWLEDGLKFPHLLGLISHLMKGLFGKKRKVRFVPKFYPYTEPSIGAQIDCTICGGKGCPSCGGAGWVTIGGAGMIHSKVLKEFNFDPNEISGFAFGLGSARLASQFAGVPKLKSLYDGDIRVLGKKVEA